MRAGPADPMPAGAAGSDETEKIFLLVLELTNPEQRESALLELSKRRETFADLAPILWHSFGTISALLQEIIAIYPLLVMLMVMGMLPVMLMLPDRSGRGTVHGLARK